MATYQAPPLDRPAAERKVAFEERRDMFSRFLIPTVVGVVLFLFGFGLGWASGRNDILENTYIQRKGMIDAPRTTELSPPPLPSSGTGLP